MRDQQRAIVIQSQHSGRSDLLSQALTFLEQAGVKVARILSIAELNTLPPQGGSLAGAGNDACHRGGR